ncbi:helix-turn-helix transcriptional regulator [Providencia heimbachae]|uniref:Type III secretion thermoregulatory protein n=1 Tax=Providencia heimbachae ATCC 35613 TaxID=1354272 RepID=A0A1B7JJ97_9GAMM|nr:AraC family transcriptional regulator [Providencia heimbachae]OAT47965.1 type III secretion thermoregulatory protein [Providencia heimbachae ATCC 35613]QCJ69531.1 AraC family transcriptional regulator [Providencia heimbachae]SQH12612.1 L-rhamnose operon regulatory protein rhaS [Providencia heimbachae]
MQDENSLNNQVIKKIRIDKNNAHSILDLPSKGIIIIEKGSLLLETPAATEILNEGDILYHKQGSYSFKIMDNIADCEFYWLPLEDDFLREFINQHGTQLSEIERAEQDQGDIIKFVPCCLMDDIKKSLKSFVTNNYPDIIVSLRISELLLLLSYNDQGALLLAKLRQLSNRQAARLQSFMEHNYLKEWKLSEFAKTFGMGLTTFKELFNTVYSTSPRSWISEKRIMYAHQLLINTAMSIVEVSMEAGFSSQSYFTQSYRKRFGYTPSRSRVAA